MQQKKVRLKKGSLSNVILILIFFAGVFLLLYPTVSDYWNSMHQSKAIVSYEKEVDGLDEETCEKLFEDAREYNRTLLKKADRYTMTKEEKEVYESLLNVSGDGMMGYVEIPKIDCLLPVYHGTKEQILQTAVGHIEGSSLPTGGKGTHCVLSGHRGLPSAKLFTNLDKLIVGDTFMLHVLNQTLTYEVDQIRIVEPHEMSELRIAEGKDYCTLVTCTPYGINTHRLLVRGHRIENAGATKTRVSADALMIEPVIVASVVAVPILLILLILLLATDRRKK